ncbi:MAG: hypothetical protein KGO81_12050 [Bacteroidota bacterium]|nr:hypothetical protein [Bacteroidota bacterium]
MRRYSIQILHTCIVLLTVYHVHAQQHSIVIQFHPKVGAQQLQLFTEAYSNSNGEPFTVNRFRFYVSHIVLIDEHRQEQTFSNDYFLVDAADTASQKIMLPTSFKKIHAIRFTVGVDSLRNVSGVQTGALDPMNGMFWTWNTGYVFAKLEGQSDSSHMAAHTFSYHVGGYKPGENATRVVVLKTNTDNDSIDITVDELKWFGGKHLISIQQYPVCHQPGSLAMQLADNIAGSFSIENHP